MNSVLHWFKFKWSSKVLRVLQGTASLKVWRALSHSLGSASSHWPALTRPGPQSRCSCGLYPGPGSTPGALVRSAALLQHSIPPADSPSPLPPLLHSLPSYLLHPGLRSEAGRGRSLRSSGKFVSLLQFQMQTRCVDTSIARHLSAAPGDCNRPGDSAESL